MFIAAIRNNKLEKNIFIFQRFLLIGMEAATPAESARTEDPEEQRLKTPRPVATSLKQTSCLPPRKASAAMEMDIY